MIASVRPEAIVEHGPHMSAPRFVPLIRWAAAVASSASVRPPTRSSATMQHVGTAHAGTAEWEIRISAGGHRTDTIVLAFSLSTESRLQAAGHLRSVSLVFYLEAGKLLNKKRGAV